MRRGFDSLHPHHGYDFGDLSSKSPVFSLICDTTGRVIRKEKRPSFAEKVDAYLDAQRATSPTKTPRQIVAAIQQSDQYRTVAAEHPEIDVLLVEWTEKP